ncbi:MAG: hypothetical protein M3Z66_01060 [Chloroflexota bacterium]|nr:hypothetical protein [Chloroflexota bacterium]
MPKNERRRQQSLARKAAKRKRSGPRQTPPSTSRGALREAAHWPLYECLISSNWQEPGELAQILVARSSAHGGIAAAGFLVDLGCLGVKDALSQVFFTTGEYELFRQHYTGPQAMTKTNLDLVAKVIQEGIAYADRMGFKPNRDYRDAAILLEGANPQACGTPIPLGMDGKPFFISGPYDNVSRIMAQLDKAVGPGNSDFLIGLDDFDDPDDLDDLEDVEEEPETEEPRLFPWLFRRLGPPK